MQLLELHKQRMNSSMNSSWGSSSSSSSYAKFASSCYGSLTRVGPWAVFGIDAKTNEFLEVVRDGTSARAWGFASVWGKGSSGKRG